MMTPESAEQGSGAGAAEGRVRAERVRALRGEFQPQGDWESWLVEQLAVVTLRLSRIAVLESQGRDVAAWRAEDLWEEDRRAEVEEVGAKLAQAPGRVLARLRQSPQGCDWLIERWAGLARAAEEAGAAGWSEEQTRLAWDLLGVPESCRSGAVGGVLDEEGRVVRTPEPADLARREVAQLQALRERAGEADEVARTLVERGLSDIPSREVANLRRYERSALRHLGWLSDRMKEAGLHGQGGSDQAPRPAEAGPSARFDESRAPARVAPPFVSPASNSEAPRERTGRNEATLSRQADETKPPGGEPGARDGSGSGVEPPRKRPDLDKLARRERKRRRDRRSA